MGFSPALESCYTGWRCSRWSVGADRDESTGDIVHPGLVFVTDGAGKIAVWLAEAGL